MVAQIGKAIQDLGIDGAILEDEPMSLHTSFKVGGPADIFVVPKTVEEVGLVLKKAAESGIPVFPLGAGANILVSDRGIRGVVMDLSALNDCSIDGNLVHAGAGATMSSVSGAAADAGLGGLEFIFAMPGSVGGSVWMNARCYERSISEVLDSVELVNDEFVQECVHPREEEFGYKRSPFQGKNDVIVRASFVLAERGSIEAWEEMNSYRRDREKKGHFQAPSVGSVFKNNRDFGKPTGRIIDSLGLRGLCFGGAKVAEYHANIIVNSNNATAFDILRLVEEVERRVADSYGFALEREVLLVGDW